MSQILPRALFVALLVAACPRFTWAIDGPLSPEESLKYLKTEPGLKVELVASEPMVVDPVAWAWDEKGRMFVVEDRGYPVGPGKGKAPVGQVVMREDELLIEGARISLQSVGPGGPGSRLSPMLQALIREHGRDGR